MQRTKNSLTTPPSGLDLSGMPDNIGRFLFGFGVLVILGLVMFFSQSKIATAQSLQHQTSYPPLTVKNAPQIAKQFLSNPANGKQLVTELSADETELIFAIAGTAIASTDIPEQDVDLLFEVAMDPSLALKADNLSKILSIFRSLPEGKMKERVRTILCRALPGLDICSEVVAEQSPIVSDNQVTEKEVEVTDLGSLTDRTRDLELALIELGNLEKQFADNQITADEFTEKLGELTTKIKGLDGPMHKFREFLKKKYELPGGKGGVYERDQKGFNAKWQIVFRKWLAKQKNVGRLAKAFEKYIDLQEAFKKAKELVK